MKKLLLVIIGLPLFAMAQEGKSFHISGKLKNISPAWVYLQYVKDGEWKTDSVAVTEGKYSFSGKLAEPVQASLRVRFQADEKGVRPALVASRDVAPVFLQAGKIRVSSVDSFSNITVKGSVAHTEFTKLRDQEKPFNDQMKPLIEKYREYAKAKDQANQDKVEKEIDAIDADMSEKVYGTYVKANPKSPLAFYALKRYAGWDLDADKIEPLFNGLSDANKNYPSATEFKDRLAIARLTGIGKTAPDFTQNDTLDKPVTLSSLRGKYLLIDFWASWCGPCRAENPNVVKVFNKYKDRNFSVLGVSLDRPGQKEKWLKAIHDDQLTWTQVSDLNFWNNAVAKQYGIQAIPQNLLLDPEGKIIAKNIRGEELEKKLAEFIK